MTNHENDATSGRASTRSGDNVAVVAEELGDDLDVDVVGKGAKPAEDPTPISVVRQVNEATAAPDQPIVLTRAGLAMDRAAASRALTGWLTRLEPAANVSPTRIAVRPRREKALAEAVLASAPPAPAPLTIDEVIETPQRSVKRPKCLTTLNKPSEPHGTRRWA